MKLYFINNLLALALAMMCAPMVQAAAPTGKPVTAEIALQGGGASTAKWRAPLTASYKVHVFVPKNGAATNALYRVYPKGKKAGSADCVSSDANYPCFEITVDQTRHQKDWVQLTLNNNAETQWKFNKDKGYVTSVTDNLSAAELLHLSSLMRFEDTVRVIGKPYQSGIIFYIDHTGEHGLIAAPTDQSTGIQWYNGAYVTTGATGTATGTGLANTKLIIDAQGEGNYAARLCADLVIGTYSDWYLPSKDELELMFQNIGQIAAAPLTNVGGFASASYWSSSEYSDLSAWPRFFGVSLSSLTTNGNKPTAFYVRAVRSF